MIQLHRYIKKIKKEFTAFVIRTLKNWKYFYAEINNKIFSSLKYGTNIEKITEPDWSPRYYVLSGEA